MGILSYASIQGPPINSHTTPIRIPKKYGTSMGGHADPRQHLGHPLVSDDKYASNQLEQDDDDDDDS